MHKRLPGVLINEIIKEFWRMRTNISINRGDRICRSFSRECPSNSGECSTSLFIPNYFIIVILRINKYSINLSFNQGGEKKQSINKYSFSFRRLSMFGFSKEQRDRRQRDANSTTMMLIVVIAVFLAVELPLSTMTALHTISSRYAGGGGCLIIQLLV